MSVTGEPVFAPVPLRSPSLPVLDALSPASLGSDVYAAVLWTALLLAAVIIGIAKSGFGGGIGILAVPLVANVLPADLAVGVMLPVLIGADVVALAQHRRNRSGHHLRPALWGAVAGIAGGLGLLVWLRNGDEAAATDRLAGVLQVAVGAITLAMVALQVFRVAGGRLGRVPDTPRTNATAGALAGFVSTLAHAAGPVMTLFWLEARLDKARLVATLVVFFFLVNLLKVPGYLLLRLIDVQTLLLSAVMLAAVPVGSVAGLWLHRRVREGPFTAIMYAGAALAGARMLWLAFT